MGYSSHILNRLPYTTKAAMRWRQDLEFIWRLSPALALPSNSSGGSSSSSRVAPCSAAAGMLTLVVHSHYNTPGRIDLDKLWEDENFFEITHGKLGKEGEQRLSEVVQRLATLVRSRRAHYRTPMQMLLVGDDYRFLEATSHYSGLDATIVGLREAGINAAYSTPARYAAGLKRATSSHARAKQHGGGVRGRSQSQGRGQSQGEGVGRGELPFSNDPLPRAAYSDGLNNDWTGFFGSRPGLKRAVKQLEVFFYYVPRDCKQITKNRHTTINNLMDIILKTIHYIENTSRVQLLTSRLLF